MCDFPCSCLILAHIVQFSADFVCAKLRIRLSRVTLPLLVVRVLRPNTIASIPFGWQTCVVYMTKGQKSNRSHPSYMFNVLCPSHRYCDGDASSAFVEEVTLSTDQRSCGHLRVQRRRRACCVDLQLFQGMQLLRATMAE
jgi:hypothetical protein